MGFDQRWMLKVYSIWVLLVFSMTILLIILFDYSRQKLLPGSFVSHDYLTYISSLMANQGKPTFGTFFPRPDEEIGKIVLNI